MDSPFLSTIIWATLNEEKEGKQARILKVRLFTLFLSILFFRRPLKSIIIIVFFGELLYEQENKRFGEAQQKKVRLISSFFPLQVRASEYLSLYSSESVGQKTLRVNFPYSPGGAASTVNI